VPAGDRRRRRPRRARRDDAQPLHGAQLRARPDLFIRTGGEIRISNFLLWQVAYSELVFTDCLWPEFGTEELDSALAQYARRERRFGAVFDAAELVASGE
jgi:undecaprenyl diphosphate synthase